VLELEPSVREQVKVYAFKFCMKSLKSRSLVFSESPSFIAIAAISLAFKEMSIDTSPIIGQFDGKVAIRANEIEATITKCINQQEED
jgi:hypothetical protein